MTQDNFVLFAQARLILSFINSQSNVKLMVPSLTAGKGIILANLKVKTEQHRLLRFFFLINYPNRRTSSSTNVSVLLTSDLQDKSAGVRPASPGEDAAAVYSQTAWRKKKVAASRLWRPSGER